MNMNEAEEYAKYMSYSQAVCNAMRGKSIPYRKATMIKLKELLNEVNSLEEERTGYWIPTYGNVKCSVCGSVKDSRNVGKATHYCDYCGTKMIER